MINPGVWARLTAALSAAAEAVRRLGASIAALPQALQLNEYDDEDFRNERKP